MTPSSGAGLLKGYSLPLSPSGESAMVTPPPWHFAGEVVMVDYRIDPVVAARLLPAELDLGPDPGAAAAVFARWQWCSAAGAELDDPMRCQFNEFLVLIGCGYRGRPMARCPYAWVDHPISLVRGWIQGMPKQLGDVRLTYPMRVGRAGPRLGESGRFAGVAAVEGRRLASAGVTVTAQLDQPPALHTVPLVHARVQPAWLPEEESSPVQLVTSKVTDVEFSPVWSGPADLDLFPGRTDDLADLRPIEVGQGYVFGYAETLCHGESLT